MLNYHARISTKELTIPFKGVDEKMKLKKITAALLSVAMLICILPSERIEKKAQAETTKITYKITKYGTHPGADCGCILEPDVPGTYRAAIFQHGDLSYSVVANNTKTVMEDWVNKGLIEPMIVVTPYVMQENYNTHENFAQVQLPKVVERMEDGTFEKLISSKIDKSKKFALAGWSLGGAVTAYGGSKYRDKFPYLGIISPSPYGLYPGGVWKSWMLNDDDTKDYKFNTDEDHLFFMAAGQQEPDYRTVMDVYYNEFGEDKGFTKLTWKDGTHSWTYFSQSLFYFVYMLQHGTEPTDEELALALGTAPERTVVRPGDVVTKPALTGTLELGGKAIFGFYLRALVSNSNAENSTPRATQRTPYSYRWMRDGKFIDGERESNYLVKAEDVGHKITCVVSSIIGKYEGELTATSDVVQKADGPVAPTGLTKVDCTPGKADGAIKNVTSAMEYKNVNDSKYTVCTGTEITGLAKGTYYIRFKETETRKNGVIATIVISDSGSSAVTTTTTTKVTTTTTTTKTTTTTTKAATTTAKPTTTTAKPTTTTAKPTTTTTTAKPTTTTTKLTTVTSKATTQTTTTTAKPTTTKLAKTVSGDANLDTKVDMADAVLIMQSLSNPNKYGLNGTDSNHITAQGLANADVEAGDGVTPKDALKIGSYLAKTIKTLDE